VSQGASGASDVDFRPRRRKDFFSSPEPLERASGNGGQAGATRDASNLLPEPEATLAGRARGELNRPARKPGRFFAVLARPKRGRGAGGPPGSKQRTAARRCASETKPVRNQVLRAVGRGRRKPSIFGGQWAAIMRRRRTGAHECSCRQGPPSGHGQNSSKRPGLITCVGKRNNKITRRYPHRCLSRARAFGRHVWTASRARQRRRLQPALGRRRNANPAKNYRTSRATLVPVEDRSIRTREPIVYVGPRACRWCGRDRESAMSAAAPKPVLDGSPRGSAGRQKTPIPGSSPGRTCRSPTFMEGARHIDASVLAAISAGKAWRRSLDGASHVGS